MNIDLRTPATRRSLPRAAGMDTRERGLTLVELMVVLTILVLLATTAITATEGVLEESRFDASRTTLASIEEAVLGRYDLQADGRDTLLAGFVADVGRMPRLVGAVAAQALQELWTWPAVPSGIDVQRPAGDLEVRVPCGWRGPYLRMPIGAARLFDGHGNDLVLLKEDASLGTPSAEGDELTRVIALGADELVGGAAFDADLELAFWRTNSLPLAQPVARRDKGHVSIHVTLEADHAGAQLLVRIYGPVDGVAKTLYQSPAQPASIGTHLIETMDAGQALPIGPRVLRVYIVDDADVPANDEASIPTGQRSKVIPIDIVPGSAPAIEVTMP